MRCVFRPMDGARVLLGNKGLMLIRVAALAAVAASRGGNSFYFSEAEKERVAAFLDAKGHLIVAAPHEIKSQGPSPRRSPRPNTLSCSGTAPDWPSRTTPTCGPSIPRTASLRA